MKPRLGKKITLIMYIYKLVDPKTKNIDSE